MLSGLAAILLIYHVVAKWHFISFKRMMQFSQIVLKTCYVFFIRHCIFIHIYVEIKRVKYLLKCCLFNPLKISSKHIQGFMILIILQMTMFIGAYISSYFRYS